MADVAQLGLAVDSSQVTGATTALNQFSGAANTAAASADRVTLANGKLGPSTQTVESMAKRAGVSVEEMTKRIQATSTAFGSASVNMGTFAKQAQAVQEANLKVVSAANDNSQALGKMSSASEGNSSSFEKLAGTITRGFMRALVVGAVIQFTKYLWDLNAALAAVYSSANLAGIGLQKFQGLQTAAGYEGIGGGQFGKAMIEFNQQVDLARNGLGSLKTLLNANGRTVGDTATTFGKIADLVASTSDGARKLSILQQAGLPATREFADLMSKGAVGINAAADASTKLTNQQLAQAKQVNDAWNKFWTDFENGAKRVFIGTLDAIRAGMNGEGTFAASGPRIYVGPNKAPAASGPAPVDPAILKQQIALEQQRIGILGQMATVEQQVRAVELQIQAARLENVNVTSAEEANLLRLARAQALGTFAINAQTDAEKIRIASLFKSTEAAIAYNLVQTKINEAKALGKELSADEIAQLQASADAFAKTKVQADTYAQVLQDLKQAGTQFATDFVQGLLSGKSAMESLASAAKSLGQTLVNSGIKNIIEGLASGNLVQAAAGAVQTGVGALAEWFGGKSEAQKKAEQELAQAQQQWRQMAAQVTAFNQAAKGLNLGPITGQLQQLRSTYDTLAMAAAKAKDYAGVAQLQNMFNAGVTRLVNSFVNGTPVMTDLQQKMQAVAEEGQGLIETLSGMGLASAEGVARIQNAIVRQQAALQDAEAAADKAAAAAKRQSDTDSLIADVRNNSGVGYLNTISDAIKKFNDLAAEGVEPGVLQAWLISTAQTAINSAGLTGQAVADLIQMFPQLNGAVHDSAQAIADAAKAAADAADALAKTTADIRANVNSLSGKGYLNDFNTLFSEQTTDRTAGVDPKLLAQYFKLQAQAIVDGAGLAGSAFDDLIAQFPTLAGQVHAFVETAKAAADKTEQLSLQMRILTATTDTSTLAGQLTIFDARAQQERDAAVAAGITAANLELLNRALDAERAGVISTAQANLAAADAAKAAASATEKLNLQMRLLNATTDTSTLAGALAIFDAKAQQERDAAVAAGSNNLVLLEQVQAAERQQIIVQFAQRAIDAEKQLADQRLAQIERIQQYLDNLTGGQSSTLAPADRLAAAQSQFASQLGAARGGDQNAISNITQYADNLLSAARDFYASSQGFQNIFAQVQASLGGLIGAGIPGSTSGVTTIPGVGSITTPTAANSNVDLPGLFASLNSRIDAQTAEIVTLKTALKSSIDAGNASNAVGQAAENDKLDKIANNTARIPSSGNLALASPSA